MNYSISGDTITVNIFDYVGIMDGEAEAFKAFVDSQKDAKKLICNINSYGGSVIEGMGIYATIKNFSGESVCNIQGFACSMGSVIALAAKKTTMVSNGFFMLHNAACMAMGNQHDLTKAAEVTAAHSQACKQIYMSKSGMTDEEVTKLMDAETWLSAKDAADKKFVDEVLPADNTTNHVLNGFNTLQNAVFGYAVKVKEQTDKLAETEAKLADTEKKLAAEATLVTSMTDNLSTVAAENEKHKATIEDLTKKVAEVTSEGKNLFDKYDTLSIEHIKKMSEMKELENKLEAKNTENHKQDEAIKLLQSVKDKAVAENQDLRKKLSSLTIGALAFEAEENVVDWKQALSKCDGDYVKARKQYPTQFAQYMKLNK